MESINKVSELIPGEYKVLSYESKNTKYGESHIIEAEHEGGEKLSFWSNRYLSDYLSTYKPKRKFNIIVRDNIINIGNYTRKTVLY